MTKKTGAGVSDHAGASSHPAPAATLKVSEQHYPGASYARIVGAGHDMSVQLAPTISTSDSLKGSAADLRRKAQRYLSMAVVMEAAALVC